MERRTNISHSIKFLQIDHVDGNVVYLSFHIMLCHYYVIGVSPPADGSEEITSTTVVETDKDMTVTVIPGVGK